ncbi:hypothetical protein HNV12_16960 [Methanococcoides sp. SA1]|nr:hypothetical protein [Methanococcoides sp. SA1]
MKIEDFHFSRKRSKQNCDTLRAPHFAWKFGGVGMSKRGGAGFDMVKMIPRILMIVLVALGIFGLFVISFEYYVDIRDAEARILAREVSVCLVEGGVLDLGKVEGYEDRVLIYCGLGESNRFYVGVKVSVADEEVVMLQSGDSGAIWVRDLFQKVDDRGVNVGRAAENVDEIIKYDPGYFVLRHGVLVDDGFGKEGEIEVEVLVRNDE